jgi:valyl-tRNA synthetase
MKRVIGLAVVAALVLGLVGCESSEDKAARAQLKMIGIDLSASEFQEYKKKKMEQDTKFKAEAAEYLAQSKERDRLNEIARLQYQINATKKRLAHLNEELKNTKRQWYADEVRGIIVKEDAQLKKFEDELAVLQK